VTCVKKGGGERRLKYRVVSFDPSLYTHTNSPVCDGRDGH
jgi:hypothetical protein